MVSKEGLENILQFCYVGKLVIDMKTLAAIFEVANFLHMENLFNDCIKVLKANLNYENALTLEKITSNLAIRIPSLRNTAHKIDRFVLKNFVAISNTESFLTLDNQSLLKLLSRNQLNVENEEQVKMVLNFYILMNFRPNKRCLKR